MKNAIRLGFVALASTALMLPSTAHAAAVKDRAGDVRADGVSRQAVKNSADLVRMDVARKKGASSVVVKLTMRAIPSAASKVSATYFVTVDRKPRSGGPGRVFSYNPKTANRFVCPGQQITYRIVRSKKQVIFTLPRRCVGSRKSGTRINAYVTASHAKQPNAYAIDYAIGDNWGSHPGRIFKV